MSRQSLDAGDGDAEARLRLAASRLDAERGHPPGHARGSPGPTTPSWPTTAARAARWPLRRLLARQFAAEGIEAGADQILLTESGTQAIDLICRFLLRPGDTVLVDDPCYFNFQALLRAHQAQDRRRALHARPDPIPTLFAEALAAHRPRLYITNSALHNPTGATMSPQIAHRLLNAAAAHDLTIVEDDIFADFEPEPSPRLAALDGLARVIRIGSFSKTLSASIRCGYIAARPTGSRRWSTSRSRQASADRARSRRNWSSAP